MTIEQMNKTIDEMRCCYKFEDSKTRIRLGSFENNFSCGGVTVFTEDENGTYITMEKKVEDKGKVF